MILAERQQGPQGSPVQ